MKNWLKTDLKVSIFYLIRKITAPLMINLFNYPIFVKKNKTGYKLRENTASDTSIH